MRHGKWLVGLLVVTTMANGLVHPVVATAQMSETTAFLADLSNQYRVVPNVTYHEANNHENKLDLYLPANTDGPVPVLMMIHGGGWVAGTKESQLLRAMPYLEMGWAVVNVTYRLVQVSRAPAAVEDCVCALQWIARNADTYNFDLSRVVTTGNSAGGHLALTTGMVPTSAGLGRECTSASFSGPSAVPEVDVAAIINWYGITDVVDLTRGPNTKGYAVQWIGGLSNRNEIARLTSPLTHVRKGLPPVLTIHGDADPIVPYQHAVRLHQALDGVGVVNKLHTVPGGGHGGFSTDETLEIYETILGFLKQHGL
ncbi:MAG: alpha/beta hydrolase [Acidobacteriota bacterium]|nr:alpha/beta hydrolase [Acidobacteriota bacterium]